MLMLGVVALGKSASPVTPTITLPPSNPSNVSSMTASAVASVTHTVSKVAGGGWASALGGYAWMFYLLIAVFGLVGVALVGLLVLRRVKFGGITRSAREFNEALLDPSADAMGLLLDLNSNVASFVPLRRVESLYFSKSVRRPAIIVGNASAPAFSLSGKPLIIATVAGDVGFQSDPKVLTELGVSKIIVNDEAWDTTTEPFNAYKELIRRLASKGEDIQGSVKLAPDLKLGFAVQPPKIVVAMIRQSLDMVNSLINALVSFSSAIDKLAEAVKQYRRGEIEAKAKMWSIIFFGLSMAILVGGLVWYLLSMHH